MPLISFSYASKLFGADQMGRNDFSRSIVSYFMLIAALGINTYSIREGAKIRDNRQAIELFAAEIYLINLVSIVLSYLMLIITVQCMKSLYPYRDLIAIYAMQTCFTTFGMEWVFSIYEDYAGMAKRSLLIQGLSLIGLFGLVRDASDLYKYTLVMVFFQWRVLNKQIGKKIEKNILLD